MGDLKAQIAHELYRALQSLGADNELLSVVGSYGDTLDDDDVLALLKNWNARVLPIVQSHSIVGRIVAPDRRKRFQVIEGGGKS